jgi:hypothetical protein
MNNKIIVVIIGPSIQSRPGESRERAARGASEKRGRRGEEEEKGTGPDILIIINGLE